MTYPIPLIDGLLYPETVLVVGGLVKARKTWLSLQLALCGVSSADFLGHSEIKMMKRYAHLDQAHKRKALALLPGWTVGNTRHKSGTNTKSEEKGPEGRNPPALVFTGAEEGS